jgi:HSP20 family protein
MTLVKFKRGNGSNENSNVQSRSNQSNQGLSNDWSLMWPFNSIRPFVGSELLQDFFNDDMGYMGRNIGTTLPAVNIEETDNDLIIEVAAPGMNKKDFKVEVADNHLHIGYRKEAQNQSNESNHWRKEFNFESFERNFTLPAMVEGDKIEASYDNGLLRITIPKKEEARRKPAKNIEIR